MSTFLRVESCTATDRTTCDLTIAFTDARRLAALDSRQVAHTPGCNPLTDIGQAAITGIRARGERRRVIATVFVARIRDAE